MPLHRGLAIPYAIQDGNWNTIAICDTTGSVGERYAYSAYGAPVFMTGAGVVQSASTIGFETLYAGYRWDNPTPQMYYVRNRFLLPQVGTWNRRDPLGYVDGIGLYSIVHCSPLVLTDYIGLFDGGATVVIGGGIAAGGSTLVTTSTAGGIAGTTLVGGGSGVVYATTTATTSTVIITGTGTGAAGAAGAAGTGTLAGGSGIATVAGGGIATTAATAAAGAVVIAAAAYGTYQVANPFWEWVFWDPNLEGDPSVATGLQPTCGPTTGLTMPLPINPGDPRGRPRPRPQRKYCDYFASLMPLCDQTFDLK